MSNFFFSHNVFKRLVSQGRQKVPLCGNGLNHILWKLGLIHLQKLSTHVGLPSLHRLSWGQTFSLSINFHYSKGPFYILIQCIVKTFTKQSQLLTSLRKKPFENISEKEKMLVIQNFLLFPQWFLPSKNKFQIFSSIYFCPLQVLSIWTPEILLFVKEYQYT